MTEQLVSPGDAGAQVAEKVRTGWAAGVCAEVDGTEPFRATVRLRPGVTAGAAAARFGFDLWHEWVESWRDVDAARLPGVEIATGGLTVEGVRAAIPVELRVTGLDAAVVLVQHLGGTPPAVDLGLARAVAGRLRAAGGVLTPPTLKKACKLSDVDAGMLVRAVEWLANHPDVGGWTARQLPVPGVHSKWLEANGSLLRDVSGRDVRDEVRPRLAVVHLTYVDPAYLATGGRRHDAWTTGDVHDIAYTPRTVLVVENRDSRLWFPPLEDALVVEGGGRAAAVLLAGIPWVRRAENIVYWGDIDSDGFAILDHFRRVMAAPADDGSPGRDVSSILMDASALRRYEPLGVSTDQDGRPIPPSSGHLAGLNADERVAYHAVATAGPAPFRRIEQERIPGEDARAALLDLVRA
ncbi:Wadjet anti-phage system protein JetD domain-containing protein [Promicromonospora panici]|uniref:Wadjet anti-phage system protein JetD domain-containing protein n=1 Tax=Promicromonospora panici TaxID=2219658 RepID=UPI001A931109|nr:Wadjet anti-phage system protein JetD domain-containing protein [Promicromonospora panici]